MKTTIILICFISVGLAQELESRLDKEFTFLDTNVDGQVSISELRTKYDAIDTNSHGKVTLEEFLEAEPRPITRAQKTVIFNFYDSDNDRLWTRDVDMELLIKNVDKNSDKMINKKEFTAFATELHELMANA